MAKSKKPRGLRIDENLFQSLSEKKLVTTAQNYISYLELYYVSNHLKEDSENKLVFKQSKANPTNKKNIESKIVFHEVTPPFYDAPPANRYFQDEVGQWQEPKKDNTEIKKQIEAIRAEKIPKERDTILGRKIWNSEQENRIKELFNQLQ
jgi:predicted Holliday junction resolvase-like endonuclease